VRAPTRADGSELRFWLGVVGLLTATGVVCLWLWAAAPVVLLGWDATVVTSGSMSPRIQTGDVVLVQPDDGAGLQPGAVILYEDAAGRGLITHRIIDVNDDGSYRTQGDANVAMDAAPVHPEQVVGTGRLLVPLVGLPSVWLQEGRTARVVLVLAAALAAAWCTRYGLLLRYDPWAPPQAASPRPRAVPRTVSLPTAASACSPTTDLVDLPAPAPLGGPSPVIVAPPATAPGDRPAPAKRRRSGSDTASRGWSVALWEVEPAATRRPLGAASPAGGG
jgi:signal peptidase I